MKRHEITVEHPSVEEDGTVLETIINALRLLMAERGKVYGVDISSSMLEAAVISGFILPRI